MRRKDCWKAFRDLTRAVKGEVDLKVEVLDVLWNARLVVCVALGSCLIHVVMAIGRRRTNAMVNVVCVKFEMLVLTVEDDVKFRET